MLYAAAYTTGTPLTRASYAGKEGIWSRKRQSWWASHVLYTQCGAQRTRALQSPEAHGETPVTQPVEATISTDGDIDGAPGASFLRNALLYDYVRKNLRSCRIPPHTTSSLTRTISWCDLRNISPSHPITTDPWCETYFLGAIRAVTGTFPPFKRGAVNSRWTNH